MLPPLKDRKTALPFLNFLLKSFLRVFFLHDYHPQRELTAVFVNTGIVTITWNYKRYEIF